MYEAIRAEQYEVIKHLRQEPTLHHLELSLEVGNEAVVSLLLDLGAEADPEDHWQFGSLIFTPLHLAAKAGQAGIVGLLLDAGADADRPACEDPTTWEQTCNGEECDVSMTESALHLGAIGGHVDVIEEITKREPSIVNSVAESKGYTALHYAAKHRHPDSIDALVEAGADLEAEAGFGKGTALHIAAESPGCETTLLALLRHGAKVDPVRHGDKTPLLLAVEDDNVGVANLLVSAGAEVRAPLLLASESSRSDAMILTLLRGGADVNTKRASDGNTPLHLAAMTGNFPFVDVLLKAGGDETTANNHGETPLDVVGRRKGTWWLIFGPPDYNIRALLVNAPRDRADRAWSRRGFFMLCRAFPERVRLQLAPSQDDRVNDAPSAASSASDDSFISRENKKRVATAAERGGGKGERLAGALTDEGVATAFRAAMGRLMGLEADIVFRTIMEFV